jgi:pimeloyl-ACP methyl ester carboxylesterase
MNATLIFLHGWGGSQKSFAKVDEIMKKKGYSTLRLEMPGFGKTPEMKKAWEMDDFALWVKRHILKSKINNYVLIGHSFGGRIILHSIVNKILKPSHIVLIDSSGIKPKNTFKTKFWKLVSRFGKIFQNFPLYNQVRKYVYKILIRERDYLNTSGNLKKTFQNINTAYYDKEIKNIKTPTLIIWGKNDKITPVWMANTLSRNINNSKLKVIEGDHSLPLKRAETIASIIDKFLKTTK